ncbi:D-alanyl-D-alanine endopeptidase [Rhodocyclus purpureus]|uniref:D-alanyl-D-alanine endopeptidase n=1 Tax=Rhodocyclus purpureus TaxID=1067 RepID=UPI00191171B3|nr:D-alanyl-D-alanine endopeptidase [Rhodocyclus purpureus]MBK5914420.1 D-alanyl-D-alanine endopeptidase [Rhodocyclus purpureus]
MRSKFAAAFLAASLLGVNLVAIAPAQAATQQKAAQVKVQGKKAQKPVKAAVKRGVQARKATQRLRYAAPKRETQRLTKVLATPTASARLAPAPASALQPRLVGAAVGAAAVTGMVASSSSLAGQPSPQQLALRSNAALVIDQSGGQPVYQKNADVVAPIASITKLMTAMVVLDSRPDMSETIEITRDDVDTLRNSRSRLPVGASLSRENALLLALMSSENRAAHALARHYPGGLDAFVAAMNRKAAALGMTHTQFFDPTGLRSENVSTARDLAKMVEAAARYPLIREFSTTAGSNVDVGRRSIGYTNTNRLVKSDDWEIHLSKTGYIHEAGKCLVMQARVADKPVVIVLLDSVGSLTRIGDANRIKRWIESTMANRRTTTSA